MGRSPEGPGAVRLHLEAEGFRLGRVLGQGLSGQVYEALHVPTDTPVALKLLRETHEDAPQLLQRFRRELALLRDNPHPDLVTLLDSHVEDPPRYLVFELLAGGSLGDHATPGRLLAPEEALAAAATVARGLSFLHANGVVHRDVKPANVLRGAGGRFKLADLGLGRGPRDAALTRTGAQVGTLDYLAPELLRGDPHTPRSDLFALGVMLVELLLGVRPQITPMAPKVPWKDLEALGSQPLCDLFRSLLASDPTLRPESAQVVAAQLAAMTLRPQAAVPAGSAATRTAARPPVATPPSPPHLPAVAPGSGTSATTAAPPDSRRRLGALAVPVAFLLGLGLGRFGGEATGPEAVRLEAAPAAPARPGPAAAVAEQAARRVRRHLEAGARVLATAVADARRVVVAVRVPQVGATGRLLGWELRVLAVDPGAPPRDDEGAGAPRWSDLQPADSPERAPGLAADDAGCALLLAGGPTLLLLDASQRQVASRVLPVLARARLLGLTAQHVWVASPEAVHVLTRRHLSPVVVLPLAVGPEPPLRHRDTLEVRGADGALYQLRDGRAS